MGHKLIPYDTLSKLSGNKTQQILIVTNNRHIYIRQSCDGCHQFSEGKETLYATDYCNQEYQHIGCVGIFAFHADVNVCSFW